MFLPLDGESVLTGYALPPHPGAREEPGSEREPDDDRQRRSSRPWPPRTQEKLADRVVVDHGYGLALAEVFTGGEFQRAQARRNAPRPGLRGSATRFGPAAGLGASAQVEPEGRPSAAPLTTRKVPGIEGRS